MRESFPEPHNSEIDITPGLKDRMRVIIDAVRAKREEIERSREELIAGMHAQPTNNETSTLRSKKD